MDSRLPIKIAVITCAYDRPMVFKLFLKWYLFFKKSLSDKIKFHLFCGGSVNDYGGECRRIFNATVGKSGTWVESPNEPLGKKWNATISAAKGTPFDYFFILGSDDYPSISLFEKYLKLIPENNFIAITDYYLVDIFSLQCKLWLGYNNDSRDKSLGCGRLISTYIVSRNNYSLWDDNLNSGLDMSMDRVISKIEGVRKKYLSCNELSMLSIKSNCNLWKYSSYRGRITDLNILLSKEYNDDFLTNILYLNHAYNNINSDINEFDLLRTDETYSLGESSNFSATMNPETEAPIKNIPRIIPAAIEEKPQTQIEILIPSLRNRARFFQRITKSLHGQINSLKLQNEIRVSHYIDDGKLSIGYKRNWLVEQSNAKYVMFTDDDDEVSSDYIKEIYEATKKNPDVITFNGIVTFNGINPQQFNSHIDYKEYKNTNKIFMRPPGHLNAIKKDIAIRYKFKELSKERDRATDTHHSLEMVRDGALKTSVHIDKPLYIYRKSL